MKTIQIILAIFLLSVVAISCAPKTAVQSVDTVESQQTDNPPAETVLEPSAEPTKEAAETTPAPIGTRFKPVSQPAAALMPSSEGAILLTKQKKMSTDLHVISRYDAVTWRNDDTSPHVLIVERMGEKLAQGDRMEPGAIWTYKFDKLGEHMVRDIFSGDIRMVVRVEP